MPERLKLMLVLFLLVFNKPANSLISGGTQIHFSKTSGSLQHEIELVAAIGKKLTEIQENKY